MPADKRKKARPPSGNRNPTESLLKPGQQTEPYANPHVRAVLRLAQQAGRSYSRAVGILSQLARHARREDRPVEAAILDRVASLYMSGKTADEFEHNIKIAGKLMSWLPLAAEVRGLSSKERTAWATVQILKQGFDVQTRLELVRQVTQKPGAPQSTRTVAVRAMELRRKGRPWDEIASSLPCDWMMVDNPGNAIRRQVQFLERTLKECDVSLEDF